jgi:cell wall-associated NlpC family hydrolase
VATRRLRLPVIRRVLVALAAATCVVTLLPSASQADPTPSVGQVARQLDRLQNQAEMAAERYNAAKIRVATAEQALARVQAKAASAQTRLDALNQSIGTLISTLYRTDAGGSSLTLLSAKDPQTYLAQTAAVDGLTRQRAEVLRRVETARQEVTSDQLAAKQKLALVTSARADAAKAKADIDAKVAASSRLLASLKADERAKVLAAQAAAARAAAARAQVAQRAARSSRPTHSARSIQLPRSVGHASGRAAGAVAFAERQLGKRYVYAAAGPDAYDCSGLTMAAYRSVGVYLPHQSSQQFHYGRHISSSQLQPGDLVFYYSPIHHVAIYIGNGRIVHAANPGEGVTTAGVFSMPYSGAVRVG